MALNALLIGVPLIVGTVRGGIDAAQQQKAINSQVEKLNMQAAEFAKAAQQAVNTCEFNVDQVNAQIAELWEQMVVSANQLNVMKADFKQTYNWMSLMIVCIIVTVFFLLVLKKLNLLTLDPLVTV